MREEKILLKNVHSQGSFCSALLMSLGLRQKGAVSNSILKQMLFTRFNENVDIHFVFVWGQNRTLAYFEQEYLENKRLEHIRNHPHYGQKIPDLGNMFRDAVYTIPDGGFNENNFKQEAKNYAILEIENLAPSIIQLSECLELDLEIIQYTKKQINENS